MALVNFYKKFFVIPLWFEHKTYTLEECCSNPIELRDHILHTNIKKIIL